jgi:hypothetical protein
VINHRLLRRIFPRTQESLTTHTPDPTRKIPHGNRKVLLFTWEILLGKFYCYLSNFCGGRSRGLHPRTPFTDSKRSTPRARNPPSRSGYPFGCKEGVYFVWERVMNTLLSFLA